LPNERLKLGRRVDFFHHPGKSAFGQRSKRVRRDRRQQLGRDERGLPEFLFGQRRDNFGGKRRIFQDHRLEISPERGFDRRNEWFFHFDERRERAGDGGQNSLGIIQSLEQILRSLREFFAFVVDLLTDF